MSLRRTLLLPLLAAVAATGATRAEAPLATARLVADLRTAPRPLPDGASSLWLTAGRDLLFFAADDGFSGIELWATPGWPEPPRRVADLCPGPCSSSPGWFKAAGGLLYFLATDPAHGRELWRSDGTAAGTVRLADLGPGPGWGIYGPGFGRDFVAAGERLFFVAGGDAVRDLWTSDGTPEGTVAIARIQDPQRQAPRMLGAVGPYLLFLGYDPAHGGELWRSDGTAAGTRLVRDIHPGPEDGRVAGTDPGTFFAGRLYFTADDGVHGVELWSSDGSAAGTRLVRDIAPGAASWWPQQLAASTAGVYFVTATDVANELWRSDGTAAGTRRLIPRFMSVFSTAPLDARLVYAEYIAGEGANLRIAGAAPGDGRLLRSWPLAQFGVTQVTLLARAGRFVFFRVLHQAGGTYHSELWRTDGTPRGTIRLRDAGTAVTAFEDSVYFPIAAAGGVELWRSDGTQGGTRRFATIGQGDRSSAPEQLTALGGRLLFAADDGVIGAEPWTSDGTAAGTAPLGDFAPPPPAGLPPSLLAVLGDRLLFGTAEVEHHVIREGALWSTAGVPGDAQLLADGVGQAHGGRLLGGVALFFAVRAEDQEWVLRLWRSDGTAGGTAPLAEVERHPLYGPHFTIEPPPVVADIAEAGGRLWFLSGGRLWGSDGTAAGTAPLDDLCAGRCHVLHGLAAVADTLFFGGLELADQYQRYRESLWRSDGTAAGTQPLRLFLDVSAEEWFARGGALGVDRLTAAAGRLFFAGDDGVYGMELWTSDGTAAGTRMVRDLRPGAAGSHPDWITPFGGGVVFAGQGGVRGQELWRSDGSGPGTRLVRDIAPGAADAYPQELTVLGGALYFAAFHPAHGLEIWRSDGTSAGTRLLADVLPGPGSSGPRDFALAGGTLFFAAGRPRIGYELFAVDGAAAGAAGE